MYVREAHPVREGAESDGSPRSPQQISQPRDLEERASAAVDCLRSLGLTLPVLVDKMDGAVEKAYGAWPASTAVVDLEGKIRFHSRGPGGAQPPQAERVLKEILAAQKSAEAAKKSAEAAPKSAETAREGAETPPASEGEKEKPAAGGPASAGSGTPAK